MDFHNWDRGVWITWYDLPEEGRADYLSWLSERYIPALQRRPGVLWVAHYKTLKNVVYRGGRKSSASQTDDPSVPTGSQFILLVGGTSAQLFTNPRPRDFHASLEDADRAMLRMRIGERANIMTEEIRVAGPEIGTVEHLEGLSPCIQVGTYNLRSPGDEEALAWWYARWRLPNMEVMPGCVRVRKLVSIAGWAKLGILYEFDSLESRENNFVPHESKIEGLTAITEPIVRTIVHAPGSANLGLRIWPLQSDRPTRSAST